MIHSLLTAAGIIVPALLIAVAIRRFFGDLPWRIVFLILAAIFLFLGEEILTTAIPLPLDEVMRGYPYRGVFGEVTSVNPVTNDTVKQMLPWMKVAREEIFAGRAPLWNRYSFSGYPLLGNGQSAPFSPFFLATLFVPLPKQIVAMAGLKLFVSLLFGFLVLRREGAGDAASMFGAILFAFSIFQNVYLYYPMTAVTSLLPAALFGASLSLSEDRRRGPVLLLLVIASMMAGGHPESVFHCGIGVLLYMVAEWLSAPGRNGGGIPRSRLASTLGSAVGGLVLSGPVWIPVLEQVLLSQRMALLGSGQEGSISFPGVSAWILLNPDGFGNPARGTWNWILNYPIVAPTYLGLITLGLFAGILSPRSGKRERFLAASAISLFLISMNWTPFGRAFNGLPVAGWVANDRLRFVVAWFAAMVAVRCLGRILKGEWKGAAAGSLIVAVAAGYLFSAKLGTTLTVLSGAGLLSLFAFWIVAGVSCLPRFSRKRWMISAAACVVALFELFSFNKGFHVLVSREYYAPSIPLLTRLQELTAESLSRVAGVDWVFLPNASAQYGLEDIRGSDPMAWAEYSRFFRLLEIDDPAVDVKRLGEDDSPLLSFLNVRYLVAEPGWTAGSGWKLQYDRADGRIFENSGVLPRFYLPRRLVGARDPHRAMERITDYQEEVVVDTLPDGEVIQNGSGGLWIKQSGSRRYRLTAGKGPRRFIASSVPALPGWQVRVNGKKVSMVRVNGAFLGFWVGEGEARVKIDYRPLSFYLPVLGSILILCLLWRYSIAGRGAVQPPAQENSEPSEYPREV